MKAMNEFESVLALAALILAVCATTEMSLAAPDVAAGRSGSDQGGHRVAQSLKPAEAAFMVNSLIACCVRQRTENIPDSIDHGRNDRLAAK